MPKLILPIVEPGSLARTTQPRIPLGDGVTLRGWLKSDSPAVLLAFSTPDIQHWHFRRFDSSGEAESWIKDCQDGWAAEESASWAITGTETDEVLGRVTVYVDLEEGSGEVSYWILPEHRGQGLATRATVAVTKWAHDLGLHRMQLEHSTRNPLSGKVALAAGYRSEGVRRGAQPLADGWNDMHLYSHLATD